MNFKNEILQKLCFSELVYQRINKKLKKDLSKSEIEKMIFSLLEQTDETQFIKNGKNIYVSNHVQKVELTINSFTCRIITVDKLS